MSKNSSLSSHVCFQIKDVNYSFSVETRHPFLTSELEKYVALSQNNSKQINVIEEQPKLYIPVVQLIKKLGELANSKIIKEFARKVENIDINSTIIARTRYSMPVNPGDSQSVVKAKYINDFQNETGLLPALLSCTDLEFKEEPFIPEKINLLVLFNYKIKLIANPSDLNLLPKGRTVWTGEFIKTLLWIGENAKALKKEINNLDISKLPKKLYLNNYLLDTNCNGVFNSQTSAIIKEASLLVDLFNDLSVLHLKDIASSIGVKSSKASSISLADFNVVDFKGKFATSKNINKEKNYIYIAMDKDGDVGFIGPKFTHHNSNRMVLGIVKDLRVAMGFHTPDYNNCGVSLIEETDYFQEIHAIESEQTLKMSAKGNGNYENPALVQFAGSLDAYNLKADLQKVLKTKSNKNTKTGSSLGKTKQSR